jgi:hypothetical protein
MKKAKHMKAPLTAILFALGFVIGITAPATAESRPIPPMGISQTTADSLYGSLAGEDQWSGSQDFSLAELFAADATKAGHVVTRNFGDARYPQSAAANLFSNTNIFRFAGLPVTVENTTDTAGVEIFKLYHNRGDGNGVDGDYMDILGQFSDDTTSSIPVFLRFIGNDLDAKGGTWGSFSAYAGSGSPTEIFTADGLANVVYGNIFSIDMTGKLKTGIGGSGTLLQFLINNVPVVTYGATQYLFTTGRDVRVEDNVTMGDKLGVGVAAVGEIPSSSMTFVKSTTNGSMPVPRMTTAQRTAIASPVTGLQVDDSDLNALTRYNGSSYDVFSVNVPTIKSGTVAGASFAGNPKIFTVTFNTAFPDTNYSVSVISEESRSWTFQSKLAGSFVMNSNANLALTLNVDWIATAHNDP